MKKKVLYIAIWAVSLIILMLAAIFGADTEEEDDWILDMFHFAYYDRYYTPGKFEFTNFLIVFGVTFLAECIVVIAGFGLKNPQYKLFYTFAPGGALAAAVLNLFQTIPYRLISKEKKK